MSSKFALLLSYVLHPLLMPFYTVAVVMNLNTYIAYSVSPQAQRILLSLVFFTTAVLPILTALILLQKGMIKTLHMDSLNERRFPFLSACGYYFFCYFLLQRMPVPRMLGLLVLGAALAIFIAWMFSYSWKISIHMIGIGGFAGALYGLAQILNADLLPVVMLVVVLAGLLGTARLTSGSHTPGQIFTGFVVGFLCEWVALSWFSV